MKSAALRGACTLWITGVLSGAAHADPLNPLEFPSLGAVTLLVGSTYTINSMTGTLTGASLNLAGTYRGSKLVFAFDSLTVPAATNIVINGRKPVALISSGHLDFDGNLIYVGNPGSGGGASIPGTGGSGAGSGGGGVIAPSAGFNPGGGIGGGTSSSRGGSFGGNGGGTSNATYGNLLLHLEGGSGGSGAYSPGPSGASGGGAGGGAIELGSLQTLRLGFGTVITVDGGSGSVGSNFGGGGSGGGVLLHGSTVNIAASSVVRARGGPGQSVGGGGRIAVQSVNTPVTSGFFVTGAEAGVITSARVSLVSTGIDFGDVPVGSSRTLVLGAENAGDPDTSLNGRFPEAKAPFFRVGNGVFSGVRPGRAAANKYSFFPTTTGEVTQHLAFESNAGPVIVTLTGRGVAPTCFGDLNQDGQVNTTDLIEFLNRFGRICP